MGMGGDFPDLTVSFFDAVFVHRDCGRCRTWRWLKSAVTVFFQRGENLRTVGDGGGADSTIQSRAVVLVAPWKMQVAQFIEGYIAGYSAVLR